MYAVPDQAGKLVVVTGANSGTGREAARRLAGAGAHVVMAVRTVAKGGRARDEILAENHGGTLPVRRGHPAALAARRGFADRRSPGGPPRPTYFDQPGRRDAPDPEAPAADCGLAAR